MITVTMAQIESNNPCDDGWARLVNSRPASDTPDTPFPMSDILDSNGLDDTLWLTQHVDGPWREFAWQCASRVAYLNDDPRVANCLSVVRRYIDGNATYNELLAAWSETRLIIHSGAAAGAAALAVTRSAALAVATQSAAARLAAQAAASQSVAQAASRAVAGQAARAAARSAASQSVAGQAARLAARAAAEKAEGISQEEMLRELLDK